MTNEEIKYLKEVFDPVKYKEPIGSSRNKYYEAERILNGWDKIKKRSCSCAMPGMAIKVRELYKLWLETL